MPSESYFARIERIIKAREAELGRPLTLQEQDEAKQEAMVGLFVEASKEIADESRD